MGWMVLAAVGVLMVWSYAGAAESSQPAGDKEEELAKATQNPVASLISVPIQNNLDFGIGSAHAMRYTLNVQPVIPFSISEDWNLITRTILPVVYAESPVRGGDSEFGLGDKIFVRSIRTGEARKKGRLDIRSPTFDGGPSEAIS